MQITEQIIERISRKVFNTMFSPALRQSNVVMGGSGSSVSWAENAGHANEADNAGSASSVPWSGVTSKPTFATVATSGSYSDLSDKPYIPSVSASVANSTLTVTIDGTSYSLTDTNTWRPIVNNLSSTDTDKSLSAAMGKDLYDYITTLQGYFDANGNAKSALKLTTVSKTAWGKTFWTAGGIPASIDGDMTSVGDISFSASGKKIGGFLYFDTANDRIGVGVDTPLSPLHVGGAARFAGNVFPTDDYATTEYTLGLSEKRWSRVYAHYCELYGTAAACHVGTSSSARISLHWASDSKRGLYDSSDAWLIGTDGTNSFLMRGNVGLGTTSPSYKLHVSGQIYSTGGFTFLSDERKKNIIDRDVKLSVADIANAPLIHYTLKDDPLRRVRIGSIAQYWQKVLPESVSTDKEGTLSMSYDLQAHTAVVVLARRVQELEKMIYEQQTRMA
jgi:hypothetical protein